MINDQDIVTYDDAAAIYGAAVVEAALWYGRHHHDDAGRPWWSGKALAEALGLVEYEQDQERERP